MLQLGFCGTHHWAEPDGLMESCTCHREGAPHPGPLTLEAPNLDPSLTLEPPDPDMI